MSRIVLLSIISCALGTTGSAVACVSVSELPTITITDWLLNEPIEFIAQPELPAIQRPSGTILVDHGIVPSDTELQPAVLRINTHNLMQYDARLVELVTRIA